MDIVLLGLRKTDKNMVYDYANDKLFLVEKVYEKRDFWNSYRDAKAKYAIVTLIFIPFFWIVSNIDIPIIIYYLLALCLKKLAKQLFFDPPKQVIKSKEWEPISHENASLLVEKQNLMGFIVFTLIMMILGGVYCCSDNLEFKFMGIIIIICLGSICLAYLEDLITCHKLSRKLKKLRTN